MRILSFIKKCLSNIWILRSLFKTILFNFKYLPFSQAIHLPILLYKPEFINLRGKIIIDSPISFGMIKLGRRIVSIYNDSGIMIDNTGTIIFKGKCTMGNGTKISTSSTGLLEFGNNFFASAELKIACYNTIKFGDNVLIGWECLFMDTDFHQLSTTDNKHIKAFAPIIIGSNCWFACRNTVMKGSITPSWCVFGSNSLLNSDYSKEEERTLFVGQPAKPIKKGVYLDRTDRNKSTIDYNY